MTADRAQTHSKAPSATASDTFSLISNGKLVQLYFSMLASRALQKHTPRETGPSEFPAARGQEAAAVGIALDLVRGDVLAPAAWDNSPLSHINIRPSVAGTIDRALSASLRAHKAKNRKIAVAFAPGALDRSGFDRSGMERSDLDRPWLQALERASADRLPILFITWRRPSSSSDNGFNQSAPTSRKYSFPTITVDGCDVVAVYRVASEAIEHARKDHGGTHIDCIAEKGADPIRKMERYLAGKGLLTAELKRQAAAASKQLHAALSASNA
jgi:TPP-dependent pyruvate/acetoin dehydrogenase alpha subunit